jgi:cytochrome P450
MSATTPASTPETMVRTERPGAGAGEQGARREVPRPKMPAAIQTLAWAAAPTWVMSRFSQQLGETFRITFAPSGRSLVMISDPEAVKTVFTAPPDVAPSGAENSPIAGVLGPSSVLVLTGPEHMRQRKLLLPPFHGERMREYEDVIVAATEGDMASWPLGRPMRMQERTRKITLEVILRAVFGVEAERMRELRLAIGALIEPMHAVTVLRALLSRPGPQRPPGAAGRALVELDALIYDEIARRRGEGDLAQRSDILSLLLQATDDAGEQMTDSELRDELVTLLLAGHETTATSVAWAIERLVRHPDKLARLVAEIDAERDGGGEGEYLTAVVNETLRVRPVVPIVVRVLQQDMQVGEHLLRAGTFVAPCIYLTCRNPRVYEDPERFEPERFLGRAPDTFAWIPFGGGIRRCIGAAFAQMEMRLMLRTILRELHPSLPDGRLWRRGEWTHRRAVTLVPAAGARVVWKPRSAGHEVRAPA